MNDSFASNRLATLVGTRTGSASFKLPSDMRFRMPVAGWNTWKEECIGARECGNGVAVESTPESLAAGVDTQLEKALEAVQTL